MADFHIWQGAGAPHKAIKRKMDSSRKKNNFPLFKKNIFLMRQNLCCTQCGAELKAKEVFKLAINFQSFLKALIS